MTQYHKPFPAERYPDGKQTYHFGQNGESINIKSAQNGWMYEIPQLGIAAGSVYLNDVALALDDYVGVKAAYVIHDPSAGPHGAIYVTAFKRDGTW